MSSLKFALMLMACGMATPFMFHKECEPKDSTAIELTGASLTVRVWVPERRGDEILRLFITDDNLANTDISINKAVVKIENKGPRREINILEEYNKTIPHGWTEFQVTVDRKFRVFVPAIQQTIVDEDDFVEADTLHIQGKQVTVNCFTSLTQWKVALGSPASVPLAGLGPHHFALYSRKAFVPSLKVGSQRLHLHWDPELKAVSASTSNPQPLPAFTLHNFTLKCEQIPKNWKCDVMWENDGDGTLVDSVLLKEVDSLSVDATDKIDYVVQYNHKDQEAGDEERRQGKSENGIREEENEKGGTGNIFLKLLAITFAYLILFLLLFAFLHLAFPKVHHTASVGHNQERPRSWRTIPQRSRPRRPFSNTREGGQEMNCVRRRVAKSREERSGTRSIPHTASVQHNQERPCFWRTIPQRSRPRRPFFQFPGRRPRGETRRDVHPSTGYASKREKKTFSLPETSNTIRNIQRNSHSSSNITAASRWIPKYLQISAMSRTRLSPQI